MHVHPILEKKEASSMALFELSAFFLFRFQFLLRLFEGCCQKIAYQKDMVSYIHILQAL